MFKRIFIVGWVAFWGLILFLVLFPKQFARIPYVQFFKPFAIILTLFSFAYCIVKLYRQGMKRTRGG
jgi:hypothetical protein